MRLLRHYRQMLELDMPRANALAYSTVKRREICAILPLGKNLKNPDWEILGFNEQRMGENEKERKKEKEKERKRKRREERERDSKGGIRTAW